MSNLKPCPWCPKGGRPVIVNPHSFHMSFDHVTDDPDNPELQNSESNFFAGMAVLCLDCLASLPSFDNHLGDERERAELVSRWNERPEVIQ